MRIDVTEFDIRWGKPRACYACPVVMAIDRVLNEKVNRYAVTASPLDIRIWDKNDYYQEKIKIIKTPPEVGLFMDRFDTDNEVKPFSFELDFEG